MQAVKRLASKRPFWYALIAGTLAGGVYSAGLPAILLPLTVAALLFVLVSRSEQRLSLGQTLRLCAAFFMTFYLLVFSWFLDVDVSLLGGLNSATAGPLLVFCLVLIAAVMTLASLPFGYLLYVLQPRLKHPSLIGVVVVPAWVVLEWFRSLVFAAFLYAPESSIGDYWNFGSLGLGVMGTPLGYASRWLGMYGLSFLVAALALAICWALNKHYKPLLGVLLLIAALSVLPDTFSGQNSGTQANEIQPASVMQRHGDINDLAQDISIKNQNDDPKSLIVLPEYSSVHLPGYETVADKFVTSRLAENGVSIDVFADFDDPYPRVSNLEIRDSQSRIVDSLSKQLLIPTGEYLPNIIRAYYAATGQGELAENFTNARRLQKGQPPRTVQTSRFTIGPVACSGILGRTIYRNLVNDGAEVLTNSASLATFAQSKSYFRQSLQMARFHAVANHRPFIQSTTGAPAFVLAANGNFTVAPNQIEDVQTAFIDFSFAPSSYKTPYSRFGEWVLVISGLVVGVFALLLLLSRKAPRT